MPETEFHADSPEGHWAVTVPVADSEQRHENAQYSHRGSLFLVSRLRVSPLNYGTNSLRVRYTLSGPNIRQDGTPGAYVLSRKATREQVEEAYPGALELANKALAEGAERIARAADAARDEIFRVISGETEGRDA